MYTYIPVPCKLAFFISFLKTAIGQNLAISITEAQLNVAQHGGSAQEETFSKIDLFLTMAFTAELLLNGFANWLLPFLRNGWSLFDVGIVTLSIVSLSVAEMPVRVILLLRCCRVIRIFGKLPSVAKIFAALFHSLVPMTNAFFIIFVIAAICKPPRPHSRIAIRKSQIFDLTAHLIRPFEISTRFFTD